MKELSYHILDIANNSIRAKASHLIINIHENREKNELKIIISDNGNGIHRIYTKILKIPLQQVERLERLAWVFHCSMIHV